MAEVIEGVDYANARPNPAALVAAGKQFVVRYLSPSTPTNPGKALTVAELASYRAAGLAVCVVWETTATRATEGAPAGVTDARLAATAARTLGFPPGQPIYFAVDTDADGPSVGPYFRGVVSVLGLARVGAYGGIRPIGWLFDQGLITYGWQTYAWSAGRWDPRAQAQQYRNNVLVAGVLLDLDRAVTADYGQWGPDMTLTAADANTVWVYRPEPPWPNLPRETPLGMLGDLRNGMAALQAKLDELATELAALSAAVKAAAGQPPPQAGP